MKKYFLFFIFLNIMQLTYTMNQNLSRHEKTQLKANFLKEVKNAKKNKFTDENQLQKIQNI